MAAGAAAQAQTQPGEEDDTTKLAEEILSCSALKNETARLACYDALAQPLLGLEKPGQEDSGALLNFTGTDAWDSDDVEINKPWRLVWQNQGSLLTGESGTAQSEKRVGDGNQVVQVRKIVR